MYYSVTIMYSYNYNLNNNNNVFLENPSTKVWTFTENNITV